MKLKTCLYALLLLAALTRLPGLNYPNEVIFDEVHYGKFVNAYTTTGEYFFDVHPPWGKLIPAFLLKMRGYDGQQSFERIGLPYDHASALAIRLYPALVGILCPLLAFLILIDFGVSLSVAFFVGLVFVFDNGLILQSRLLLLYGPLLFWQLVTVWASLRAFKEPYQKRWGVFSGLAAGMAVGTQYPGLTAPAVMGIFAFLRFLKMKKDRPALLQQMVLFVVCMLAIYTIGFAIHFTLLPLPGSGDAFYKRSGGFWTDFFILQKVMYSASATLFSIHQDMSPWYTWPLMKTPIYYWQGPQRSLYFLSNSFIWIGGTLLGLYALLKFPKKKKGVSQTPLRIFLSLFLLSFIPLTLMSRVMFLYHYLIPILFLWLYLGAWLQRKNYLVEFNDKYWYVVGTLILAFLWMVPLTYGVWMPEWYWATIPWKVYH